MVMPTVDVATAVVTNGPIKVGEQFEWTCVECAPGSNITVTAQNTPNGEPWFIPSPISFTAPGLSSPVTLEGVSPETGWWYNANVPTGDKKVRVLPSEPAAHGKAS